MIDIFLQLAHLQVFQIFFISNILNHLKNDPEVGTKTDILGGVGLSEFVLHD